MQSWWALSALRCKQCTRIPRHPSTFTHENSTYTVNMVLTWESPDLWLSHYSWGGSLRVAWCACMCGKPQNQHLTVRQDLCDTAKRTGDIRGFQGCLDKHSWNPIPESDYSKYICYYCEVNVLESIQLLKWNATVERSTAILSQTIAQHVRFHSIIQAAFHLLQKDINKNA